MLLPVFTGEEALGSNAMKTSVESVDVLKDHSATINFSDLTAWFNLHLSMNDALYPHSLAPSYSMPSPSTPSSASSASASSTPTSLSSGGISSVGTPGSGISGGTVSQAVGTSLEIETKTDPLAYSMNNNNSLNSHRNQQPNRVVNAVSSLSKFVPTILSGCNTTVIHVLNSGISKQSSFRYKAKSRENLLSSSENTPDKSRHSSGGDPFSDIKKVGDVKLDEDSDAQSDSDIMSEINGSLNDHSMNAVTSSLVSGSPGDRMDDEDGRLSDEMDYPNRADAVKPKSLFINEKANGTALIASNKIETSLPQLFLNFCTRGNLYMLSPYYCASINGCMDSEIVIGAVYGAVIVNGCERIKITCACRKLIVLNCLECEFNVATLSTSIIAGDSRSLIFGKYHKSTVLSSRDKAVSVVVCDKR